MTTVDFITELFCWVDDLRLPPLSRPRNGNFKMDYSKCFWHDKRALDTSMLWDEFCHIRISVIYRGRAVPLIWKTIVHSSSSVAFDDYQDLLDEASRLLPSGATVVFLADRGFADTKLMKHLTEALHWHWHIRIKSSFYVHRNGREIKLNNYDLKQGKARFWHNVYLTAEKLFLA